MSKTKAKTAPTAEASKSGHVLTDGEINRLVNITRRLRTFSDMLAYCENNAPIIQGADMAELLDYPLQELEKLEGELSASYSATDGKERGE